MQLVGNFGPYLMHIPPRLGQNEALDAAADILMTAYANYRASHLKPDERVLIKHSHALRVMAKCLNDPATATTSETLAAVMLLLICQVLSTV